MSRYVYVDRDGTLTDPLEGISNCIAYALQRLGHEGPAADELRNAGANCLADAPEELAGLLQFP